MLRAELIKLPTRVDYYIPCNLQYLLQKCYTAYNFTDWKRIKVTLNLSTSQKQNY